MSSYSVAFCPSLRVDLRAHDNGTSKKRVKKKTFIGIEEIIQTYITLPSSFHSLCHFMTSNSLLLSTFKILTDINNNIYIKIEKTTSIISQTLLQDACKLLVLTIFRKTAYHQLSLWLVLLAEGRKSSFPRILIY